jgi:phosphatidylinositol alpha-1,6-mannosyltransferase
MYKKSLIVFSYDFPPSNGGIARLCQEIVVGMNNHYEEVIVLTRRKEGPSSPYNFNSVKIVVLPNKRILCELAGLSYLLKIRNKSSYDILCGVWHPEGFISIISGFKNIFILGHGTEFLSGTSVFRAKFWLPYYANFVLKNTKNVITNSNYTKGLVKSICNSITCDALPLAVNHHFFEPRLKEKRDVSKLKLGTVSRVLQFKGYDFIARVIANLPFRYKCRIEWNIAGTGPYVLPLKSLIDDLGLNNQVKFHGYVVDEELPIFYNNNDVFILCSREQEWSTEVEGFGLVFLEAQSCGIPAIGTRTGGIPDAIDNLNGGWLVEQDDDKELETLLIYLLENSDYLEEMSIKARKRVEEGCSWERYCEDLFKIMSK